MHYKGIFDFPVSLNGFNSVFLIRNYIHNVMHIMSARKSKSVQPEALPLAPSLMDYICNPLSIISPVMEKEIVMDVSSSDRKYIIGKNRTGIDLISKQSGCKVWMEGDKLTIRYNRYLW